MYRRWDRLWDCGAVVDWALAQIAGMVVRTLSSQVEQDGWESCPELVGLLSTQSGHLAQLRKAVVPVALAGSECGFNLAFQVDCPAVSGVDRSPWWCDVEAVGFIGLVILFAYPEKCARRLISKALRRCHATLLNSHDCGQNDFCRSNKS